MNTFPDVVINRIMLFVSHPCADIIREHFRQLEEQESEEEEDVSDWDYDAHCDCCVELWEDCQCWCSNCGDEYSSCRASCYG